jgi:hypothetical protein
MASLLVGRVESAGPDGVTFGAGREGEGGPEKVTEGIAAVRQQLGVDRHTGGNTTAVLQAKLVERHPAAWADYLAGKYKTVRAAATAAGLVKDANNPLARLLSNWKNATPEERQAFMDEVGLQVTEAPPAKKPAPRKGKK